MTFISSSQDLTNDLAPSSCNFAASASMSTPAFANCCQHLLAVAAIGGKDIFDLAVIRECLDGAFGHGVDRERRRQCLDVENVGSGGVLGARARPQQPLRPAALVINPLRTRRAQQFAVCLVGPLRDGDAEPVAQGRGNLAGDGGIPAADEQGSDGSNIGAEAGGDASFDAAQIRLGGGDIVLAAEQQRHVDGYTGENCFLDRRQTLLGPGYLDEKILALRPCVQFLCRGGWCPRSRKPAMAKPRATPSHRRLWFDPTPVETCRPPARGLRSPARRTAFRPTFLRSSLARIAAS